MSARKITEWHARKIAGTLCAVLGITREQFSNRVIAKSAPVQPGGPTQ